MNQIQCQTNTLVNWNLTVISNRITYLYVSLIKYLLIYYNAMQVFCNDEFDFANLSVLALTEKILFHLTLS